MMTSGSLLHRFRNLPGFFFLAGYVLVFPALLVVVIRIPKDIIHLEMNAWHGSFLDSLMTYWTYLGDGLVMVILVFGLLMISIRHFFTGLTAFAFSGLLVKFLKKVIFTDFPRPVRYFEMIGLKEQLYLVEGVSLYKWFSFPSGHTATAFAVFFAIALMTRSGWLQSLVFILAVGVGYSRIYLSQHFLVDVVAGSFVGILAGYVAWAWIRRYRKQWLDRSIYNLRR